MRSQVQVLHRPPGWQGPSQLHLRDLATLVYLWGMNLRPQGGCGGTRGAPLEVPTDPDPYVIAGGEGRVSGLLACDADGSCNRHSCCCYLVWEVVPAPSSKPHSANSHTEQWHHRVSQVAIGR